MSQTANSGRLLYHTLLYGVADALVLAVGGLLLLPLYTRTLPQADFGIYVVVKTNAELFTYVLYFGLPSAVARVYFDHREQGRTHEYMSSIVCFFALMLLGFALVCRAVGPRLWQALSPGAPAFPYLWFAFGIASLGFFASLGPLWLRLEERVQAFAAVQVISAGVLCIAAAVCLTWLHLGVKGIFLASMISSLCAAATLPFLFKGRFHPRIEAMHIRESLRFATPIVAGYVAYFVLNRTAMLILQRHVQLAEVAIYGLSQQLAMVITIAGSSFGKALQPAVFAAAPTEATRVLVRSGRMLILLMFAVTSAAMLFGWEIFALVAPPKYASGYRIFLILSWANMAYSYNLIFSTALVYQRRPRVSLAVSIVGALLSAALGAWLIPDLRLLGAALGTAIAFALMIAFAQLVTRRSLGSSQFALMCAALAAAALLGLAAEAIQSLALSPAVAITIKVMVMGAIGIALHRIGNRWSGSRAECGI